MGPGYRRRGGGGRRGRRPWRIYRFVQPCLRLLLHQGASHGYDLIEKFAEGAWRVQQAGFDCVELHGAHGYLIAQFMSPFVNKRNDRFGMAIVTGSEPLVLSCPVHVNLLNAWLRVTATSDDRGATRTISV